MKLDELLKNHAAAGARYAAATAALHESLVELASLDAVLASDTSGHHERPVRTFFDVPQNLGTLAHPKFAPADILRDWRDEIKFRRDAILNSMEISR
jgi:hypothetical protein